MNQTRFNDLFERYMNDHISASEIRELFAYMNDLDNTPAVSHLLSKSLDDHDTDRFLTEDQKRAILDRIFEKKKHPVYAKKMRWPTFFKLAASILLFTVPGLYLLKKINSEEPVMITKNKPVKNDIGPGGNKAILTLGNGAQIVLNNAPNGRLASQGNTQIMKLTNGQIIYNKAGESKSPLLYNTITTPRGGQYRLTLSDGTVAWLNAASSITYPTFFAGKERCVNITGEVYFEVAKNKKMPFYVKSGPQVIQVLGTHFDVNAYGDETDIKTTLLEGSVKVSYSSPARSPSGLERTIKPGEQATLKNNIFKVSQVDVDEATAWKNGITVFANANIHTIMKQLTRWYDIEVAYQDNIPERLFSGEISRKANLSEVLKVLELGGINFKVEGRKVLISP